MAAIYDPDEEVDIKILEKEITAKLPSYARPIFIRLVKKLDITGNLFFIILYNLFILIQGLLSLS